MMNIVTTNATIITRGLYLWVSESTGFEVIYQDPAPWKYVHLLLPFLLCFALPHRLFKSLTYDKTLTFFVVSVVTLIAWIWEGIEIILHYLGYMWYGQSDVSRMFDVIHAAIGAYVFCVMARQSGFEKIPRMSYFNQILRILLILTIGVTNMFYVHSYYVVRAQIEEPNLRYTSIGVGCLLFAVIGSIYLSYCFLSGLFEQTADGADEEELSKIRQLYVRSLGVVWIYTVPILWFGWSTCIVLYVTSGVIVIGSWIITAYLHHRHSDSGYDY